MLKDLVGLTVLKGRSKSHIVLGLEEKNLQKLKEGLPILIKGKSLGMPEDIIVYYGADMKALITQFREFGFEIPDVPYVGKGPL